MLAALDRVTAHTLAPFVAPVPEAEQVVIHTIQDGIPYRFWKKHVTPGWKRFAPVKGGKINAIAEDPEPPAPYEIIEYLKQLPRFHVIGLYPVSDYSWLVIPYNASDASQRGWPSCHPKVMHLVSGSLQSMEVYVSRSLSGTLLYEEPASAGIVHKGSSFEIARRLVDDRQKSIEAEMKRKAIETAKMTVEERLRWQLEFVGAKLLNWEDQNTHLMVRWEVDGHAHSMRLQKDYRIHSAGLCLSGKDNHYNLSSIVMVIDEARRLGRHIADVENPEDDNFFGHDDDDEYNEDDDD